MITTKYNKPCKFCKIKISFIYYLGNKVAVELNPPEGYAWKRHTCSSS